MIKELKENHIDTHDLKSLEESAFVMSDEPGGGGVDLYAFTTRAAAEKAKNLAIFEASVYTRDEAISEFCDDED